MPISTKQLLTESCAGSHLSGIPQSLNIGTAIDEILLIWMASEASEWDNRLAWLPL
jgi:hypothetical protein